MPTHRSLIITTIITNSSSTTTSKIFLPRVFSPASISNRQQAYQRFLSHGLFTRVLSPPFRRKGRFPSTSNMSSTTEVLPPQDPCQKPKTQQAAEGEQEQEGQHGKPAAEASAESALPPLSDREFKQYNRLAEHMDYFVRTLRHTSAAFLLYFFIVLFFLFFFSSTSY